MKIIQEILIYLYFESAEILWAHNDVSGHKDNIWEGKKKSFSIFGTYNYTKVSSFFEKRTAANLTNYMHESNGNWKAEGNPHTE